MDMQCFMPDASGVFNLPLLRYAWGEPPLSGIEEGNNVIAGHHLDSPVDDGFKV
jgi:hypothetical protein